jgi:hypothetical protein
MSDGFASYTVGTITGTVTSDSNGQPISSIWVEAQTYDTGEYCSGNSTNSDGFYCISHLATGTYKVVAYGSDAQYAAEFYNNQVSSDKAMPVNVSVGQLIGNINFSLGPGASISGVVKNPDEVGQVNIKVNCGANNGYGTNTQTEANGEANGFYECDGLPVGYNYSVVAYPPSDSNYMITGITVDVCQPGEYRGNDIILGEGGLKISGEVTDKATGAALASIQVTYWNNDLGIWTDVYTDANGIYELTNLPPGDVQIGVEPNPYYAWMRTEFELMVDINNIDFALPAGAILCGKVLDDKTAQPIAGVYIDYDSNRYNAERDTVTDVDGTFCLTQLPPGIAEVKAEPDVDTGYAWNLPWGNNFVCLNEGENRTQRIIALMKGALVSGYVKDANGSAISGVGYDYKGKNCNGGGETDANGFYQIRLPTGTYNIVPDDTDNFGALPMMVTITDITNDVNVPDITFYTEATGGQISGEVNNPGEYTKTGYFFIVAFEAGTIIDPNVWYTIQPVVQTEMEDAGPFSLNTLPPDVNYDIYLCVSSTTTDGIMSLAVRDSALNIAVGTTGIELEYSSQGGTVRGQVNNTDNRPVLGAGVLLSDSSGSLIGVQNATDCNGEYVIYNVPAGIYTSTAVHSKYLNSSANVTVLDGVDTNVNTITMSFAGEKEGPDLNGDGIINMLDFARFANQWLESDSLEADFNEDGIVDFADLSQIVENWLNEAIWYQE